MEKHEVSHIEIAEEEKIKEEKKKTSLWKSLLDKDGWKKDAKRIALILLAIVLIILATVVIRKIVEAPKWSLRFNAPIETVKYQQFEDAKFSFAYPESYVIDKNEKKKFGSDYLAGFHLEKDDRTGCDVRSSEIGLNFSKSDQEIKDAFTKELSANVKGFEQFEGERLKIGKRDAFQVSFLLVDPLGNSLKIQQVLLGADNGENYLLVCGSGSAQAPFFQEDFDDFFNSFQLK